MNEYFHKLNEHHNHISSKSELCSEMRTQRILLFCMQFFKYINCTKIKFITNVTKILAFDKGFYMLYKIIRIQKLIVILLLTL